MKIRIIIPFILISFFLTLTDSFSLEYDLAGKIESKRKDNIITVLFSALPERNEYLIINNDVILGKLKILKVNKYTINQKIQYRALAEYFIENQTPEILKAGTTIGLVKVEGKEEKEYGEPKYTEKSGYKNSIVSKKDNREMILIPEGKFVFGSNNGDKDEGPQQVVFLDNFYIDKYEVSNADYYYYVEQTNTKPPAFWINGKFNKDESSFPVLVSYKEAEKYAEWAGKRLPDEQEWEKAARGPGLEMAKKHNETFIYIENPVVYPWGNKFEIDKANSIEFWENRKTGNEIKKIYTKGLLPVDSFNNRNKSFYGIINMAGNACEWTSSWYNAYKESRHSNKKYGTQFKVIRGGAWFNNKYKLRTTSREIGGLPNLYEDNIAGFRCAKNPSMADKIVSE
ncbi:MAG: formylglycine-generating enzyme family protein [Spirochaetes bacterium]|nr:formylglycine-generating enzyme family protein [Spirochaetota bacterium]